MPNHEFKRALETILAFAEDELSLATNARRRSRGKEVDHQQGRIEAFEAMIAVIQPHLIPDDPAPLPDLPLLRQSKEDNNEKC
ncbi:MAG: hypothetical protein A2Y38_19010 [Spirochaetes bacterium GWB1_59_5]|nr:MAG: hypothetical protein A2Y38_19010 [Spirochaetes bacterium GWB1_59_5]